MAKGNQANRQTTGGKTAAQAGSSGAARSASPPSRPATAGRQTGVGTAVKASTRGTTASQKAAPARSNGNGSVATSKDTASRPATNGTPGTAGAAQTARATTMRATAKPSAARAAVRAEQQRYRQRYQSSRPWWRGPVPIIGTVVTVGLIVVLFIVLGNQGSSASVATQPAPAAVFQQVTNVSPTVASTVGTGGLPNPLHATTAGTSILKGAAGKPVVLYVGAEYCPYCAAERWSMVVALSRFGTFSNLNVTTSSASDAYPNTNTFTFYKSKYTSPYIDFQSVEQTTNQPDITSPAGYKLLQVQTQAQQDLINTYDGPPYASQQGAIPFIDFGNQFVSIGQGVPPQVLQGQSWQDIASALSNPQSPMTQYIVGNANYLTAAICQATNNQPANVCGTTTIKQIQGQLAQLPKGK